MNQAQIEDYWQSYLTMVAGGNSSSDEQYDAEPFGDNLQLADELGKLVLVGVKTATCSALWEWEAEGSPLPEVGLKTIVLDGKNKPLCIIETTEVKIRAFREVDAQFAYDEGEGDRSLDAWRTAHWEYFSRVLPLIGKEPTSDMPLVCERFRVVYK
ncbi:hypothetical protein Nos7524_0700 [Nostoc sp. PCC 7524]|uniref:ASCH domain-containing protein n=1 Tax=Nostoc sp. (strain ATCC 29411 / PCC 7524) TaxID=28072 RepID=UPI00029F3025|nr:ASCH domain-containing protein [Nostoc sp. PCC 7524]AFY46606.1 hypothetical protein Nos7524_0700 [Nostoc sp. PCC 7524]